MRNDKLDMKKKGRGAAKLPDEWDSGVKIQVTLNAEGQVVGVKEQYNKYCSALGALARIGTLLPLNYTSWYHMPKDKLDAVWKDVQANTTLPPEAKSVVLRQLNNMWRDWKRRLKADHFTRYIGDVDHDFSELPNEQVELDQWLVLVQYWKHDEVQVANELIGMPEPQSSTKESAPPQPKSRKSLNFPMPPEQVVAINADNRRNDNGYNCSPVQTINPDYLLLRPRRGVNTVQDAVGKSVAWEYIDIMEN
ncbi:UNVERIFIED_CONTAM: hypothetical protein Slati_3663900 [Sesamum latifolium]|uniref:Uncharacterized protein n=1 Tax=Sesamum latifolium TaxID=2727402 RepID=A0AAW2U1P6_9LAMI